MSEVEAVRKPGRPAGSRSSEEFKQKMSDRMKRKWDDPEFRNHVMQRREEENTSEKIRLGKTPEGSARAGRAVSEAWASPEGIRKRIAGLLRKLELVEGRPENSLHIAED